jgi:drug/metabolite transporter (DMT)-like permease
MEGSPQGRRRPRLIGAVVLTSASRRRPAACAPRHVGDPQRHGERHHLRPSSSDGLPQLREMTVITAVSMAGSGILGQAIGDTLYINALGFLGVSRTFPITNSAYPFLTFVFAVLLLGETLTWTLPIGGLLIVVGISWIVLEQRRADAADRVKVELVRGVVFAVTAALAWAGATVRLRGQQGNLDAVGAASLAHPRPPSPSGRRSR